MILIAVVPVAIAGGVGMTMAVLVGCVAVMMIVRHRVLVAVGCVPSVCVGVIERLIIFTAHTEFGAAHSGAQNAFGPDRIGGDRQAAQGPPYVVERNSSIDQRTQDHVPGSAGKAVEVENPQLPSILSRSHGVSGARTAGAGWHLQRARFDQ